MSSLSITWDVENATGDWEITSAGLATGRPLSAAVLVSLFSDRRAGPDDVIADGSGNRRGWWGDSYSGLPIGSRLWLLKRAKRTSETLRRAREYITEALDWLLTDEVAAAVDVTTEWQGQRLAAQVTIRQGDGQTVALRFASLWTAETA